MKGRLTTVLLLMALCIGCPNQTPSHKVTLTWTESTPGVLTYEVYKASNAASQFLPLASVADTTYEDTNVKSGDSPCYEVTASADGLISLDSNEFCVTIP